MAPQKKGPENMELTEAALEAIALWPGSDRELALSAGIQPVTIRRLRERHHGVSEETAGKILGAIRSKKKILEQAEGWLASVLER
jgi:hypothetical protein